MSKRRRRKKRINWIKLRIFCLMGIILCLFINLGIFTYRNIYPIVMDYAKNQSVNIATLVIQQGIAESGLVSFNMDEVLTFEETKDGYVSSIAVNAPLLNQLLVSTTKKVEEKILLVESGDFSQLGLDDIQGGPLKEGISFNVPLGSAFNLSLLHDYGPKFPVTANVIGNAVTDVKTDVQPYGINNAMLKIYLSIKVSVQVQMPFKSEQIEVFVESPLAIKIISGQIPQYYYIGNSTASPLNPTSSDLDSGSGNSASPNLDVSEGMENLLLE
ncbi:MAG TPA: sporulation protein YunB [Firmicutes bacterium]|nr:sporulation protein YunB [Bacillota bacterium]